MTRAGGRESRQAPLEEASNHASRGESFVQVVPCGGQEPPCSRQSPVLAGCGKSASVTGSSEPAVAGNAVLLGTVQGVGFAAAPVDAATHQSSGGTGYTVTVVGAAGGTVEIDEDGRFVLAGLPAGAVTLRIEGGGVSAQVTVQGLVDGQVLTVEMKLTGGTVQLTGSPTCAPVVADAFFSGDLESVSTAQIVVSRRVVDVTKLQKVWTPGGRAQLSDLRVGDRIKVWGTLRGDGVLVADEIVSVTNDAGETWFSFKGRVDGVSGSGARALDDVHGSPNAGYSPTLSIAGKTVYTSGSTKFKWSDGGTLDPREIKVGQTAYVEGYRNKDGALKASSVVVDGSGGSGGEPSWVSFRGKVAGVVALSARDVQRFLLPQADRRRPQGGDGRLDRLQVLGRLRARSVRSEGRADRVRRGLGQGGGLRPRGEVRGGPLRRVAPRVSDRAARALASGPNRRMVEVSLSNARPPVSAGGRDLRRWSEWCRRPDELPKPLS